MQNLQNKLLLVFALGLGLCLGAGAITWSQGERPPGDQPLTISPPAAVSPGELSTAFRQVARDVLPAVVSIKTHTEARAPRRTDDEGERPLNPNEEFFRRFFGDDPRFEDFFQFDMPPMPRQGRGSGFIVDAGGVIMTNSHVVSTADRVVVHLHDGRELEADSWVSDPRSDVAIVRISAGEPLPTVPLGDSDAMQIGDWVLAMGNPFDVGVTVTAGIISATGRGPGINERESYLQTDAAINPGNSGGPLVNLQGQVVGINTAISTSSGGNDGVGFAIPMKMASWVANQLIAEGTVRRAYLGVALQPLTNELRRQFGVDVGQGALVSHVGEDTPASRAGFEPGDIVLRFADVDITDPSKLQEVVEVSEIGREYTAVVWRNGKRVDVPVVVEEMPSDFTTALRRGQRERSPDREERQPSRFEQLGLELEDLTPSLAEQLGLDVTEGVVVRSVARNSPASRAGLRPGVVIEKVGSTDVSTVEEFAAAVEELSIEDGIVLLVRTGEGTAFVVLKDR